MKREQLLIRWADELGLKGNDQLPLFCMLKTLSNEELVRFFVIKDKEHGMSTERIARKYSLTVGVIKGHIDKAKKLAKSQPV